MSNCGDQTFRLDSRKTSVSMARINWFCPHLKQNFTRRSWLKVYYLSHPFNPKGENVCYFQNFQIFRGKSVILISPHHWVANIFETNIKQVHMFCSSLKLFFGGWNKLEWGANVGCDFIRIFITFASSNLNAICLLEFLTTFAVNTLEILPLA